MTDEPKLSTDSIDEAVSDGIQKLEALENEIALPEMPKTDAELDKKLADLEVRARKAKISHEVTTKKRSSSSVVDQNADRGLAYGMSAAYALIGLPIAFFAIGWLAEKLGAQGDWKVGLGGIGVFIGFGFMLLILRRLNSLDGK